METEYSPLQRYLLREGNSTVNQLSVTGDEQGDAIPFDDFLYLIIRSHKNEHKVPLRGEYETHPVNFHASVRELFIDRVHDIQPPRRRLEFSGFLIGTGIKDPTYFVAQLAEGNTEIVLETRRFNPASRPEISA